MQIPMTPIDERHFRPDPEGKRMFVLHDWPPTDIDTKREFDVARSDAPTSARGSQARPRHRSLEAAHERGALCAQVSNHP